MAKISNKKDILLLLLYSPGGSDLVNEPIVGRTRIIKMMYIFKKEILKEFKKGTKISEEDFYNFFPWNYGPFSDEIYGDLDFFVLHDFIEIKTPEYQEILKESIEEFIEYNELNQDDVEYIEEEFVLTSKGQEWTKNNLYTSLNENQKKILTMFKDKVNSTPLQVILKYVYSKYPEMTKKSLIKNEIIG